MLNNPNFKFDTDESEVFLLSAWHELFNGFTPDSYQPRLHNVPSLVAELVSISKLWANKDHLKIHRETIQKELKKAMLAESDLLSHLPVYRTRCESLVNAKEADEIICGGNILRELHDEYWECFISLAKKAINQLPVKKADALRFIRRLATFAFQNGKEDDDAWRPFESCANQNAAELVNQMIEVTQSSQQVYVIALAVIGNPSSIKSIARSRGFKLASPKHLPEEYVRKVDSSNSKTQYIEQNVKAVSIRRAVAEARKNVSVDIGLVSLYTNPDDGIRLHPAALVSLNGPAKTFIQSEQAFRRLHPRRDAAARIKSASGLILNASSTDRRLLAAVEQLALASASSDSRNRFVNLWAALETLAGTHEGPSAMKRVCGLIVPLITSRHIHRTTRYLTILVEKYRREFGTKDFGPGFSSRKRKLKQDDMLLVLASPACNPKISGLLAAVKHPLLRWKIRQCWEYFSKPQELAKKLGESKDRLEWQIARIYRARNMLVHEGAETPFIVPLLDNLQNYLSTLVQRLIHELELHPDWTIRQVVEYWNGRMNHIFVELKCRGGVELMTDDFLEQVKHPKKIWFPQKDSEKG